MTGVPAATIRQLARRLAAGRSVYILTGRGVEQHADGTDTATAAVNLALLLGLPGTPGNGYGTLTGQGNGQGGREHGQKSDQLPGYRKITDAAARAHVAAVWGVDPDAIPGPGIPAVQLLQSAGLPEVIRALLVHGSNVVVSAPNVQTVRDALGRLDLLVVCDFFLSETARARRPRAAGPAVGGGGGHDDQSRGARAATPEGARGTRRAPAASCGSWRSSHDASRRPASGAWTPPIVFDELARASAGGAADYSGLSHALLDDGRRGALAVPVGSTGTPRLFAERFGHDDGRARLVAVHARTARGCRARRRAHAHHRPPPRALPERRPDPPRPRAGRRASRARRAAASGDREGPRTRGRLRRCGCGTGAEASSRRSV